MGKLLNKLRSMSIRSKLRLMIVIVSGLSLLMACLLFLWGALAYSEHETRRELTSLGDSLAYSSLTPLDLDLPEDGHAALNLLRHNENVVYGAVYRVPENTVFVDYRRAHTDPVSHPAPGQLGFNRPNLEYAAAIVNPAGQQIGTILLVGDVHRQGRLLQQCLLFLLLGICVASAVAWLVANPIARVITGPILDLLRVARAVTGGRDYSLRARDRGRDEVSELVRGFNEMLNEIERRTAELHRQQQTLEDQVAERTIELVRLSEDMSRARDAAETANRVKSAFLANMSHELRTPLTAVLGYSEMLIEDLASREQADLVNDVRRIHDAGSHLLAVISDLLDHSKIEAGKIGFTVEPVDLRKLIDDSVATISPLVQRNGNTLSVQGPPVGVEISTDPTKLRQVLFNLLSNACKFTEQGRITLTVEVGDTEGARTVFLRVIDSGIGMTEEQSQRIFTAFTQADPSTFRKYGGTGLGLAISRKYCEMMGGSLTVSSTLGQGSVFTAKLVSGARPRPPGASSDEPDVQ